MSAETSIALADELEGVAPPFQALGLVGHEDVYARLVKQLADRRLPGGILLHGPKGIGKATLAYQLAIEIFSVTGDEPEGRVIEQVRGGAHPNLYSLGRRLRERGGGFYSEIRVDDMRQTLRQLQQTRGRPGHRILVVDAMEDCNRNAANALLKTLEEPPSDTLVILVSHRPGRLLPTIRSRCQAHAMRALDDEQVKQVLLGADMEQNAVAQAVRLAGGRPRRGFEALAMGQSKLLNSLADWLKAPGESPGENLLKLAEGLADKKNLTENGFAREMLLDWIAQSVTNAALHLPDTRQAVNSANALWEQANKLFEQTDTYNLDAKQCLIILFDEIIDHTKLIHSNS
ncbi:MAG TPA: AAA family ATPase [Devosia sp.]|nr:AAA family ATPase [Devosia sp.]